jgi:protein-S-isoprenylcysteine O-methyltransferase Ste14
MKPSPPNTIPWPPVVYIATALASIGLNRLYPLPWPSGAGSIALTMVGVMAICVAITIEVSTALAFRRHKTSILPHRSATRLITTGPFSWSRNPIYLANTLLLVGAGLTFGISWMIALGFVAAAITQELAIKREELHLEKTFGSSWHTYQRQTKRWFGRGNKAG